MQVYLVPRNSTSVPSTASLPQPNDPSVELDIAGGELIAVRRFEGYATEDVCRSNLQQLVDSLKDTGLQIEGLEDDDSSQVVFRLAQYGPLHSLNTRLNEIWVSVKASLG